MVFKEALRINETYLEQLHLKILSILLKLSNGEAKITKKKISRSVQVMNIVKLKVLKLLKF